MNYIIRKECRLCGVKLPTKPILSLGKQCISAFVDTETKPILAPLDLVLCSSCNLLQLKHTTLPTLLYNDNYGYRTGLNSTMIQEMSNLRDAVMAQKRLEPGDVVVDIGASDGTLLSMFPPDVIKVAFEPVKKFGEYYQGEETILIQDFFNAKAYSDMVGKKAKVITAIAMFYDLDDPNSFLKDIIEILADDGILVIQMNYLPKMLREGTFDNISHEHVAYYSLYTLYKLLEKHNLEIFHVKNSPINGGCFRVFIFLKGKERIRNSVKDIMWDEHKHGLDTNIDIPYLPFIQKIKTNVDKLSTFIKSEHKKGKKIWIYGASTRGNVILQAAGLKYPVISGASERNPEKWDKKTLGTNIPMFSEEEARKVHPDYFLVLPYWFKAEFVEREKEYLESGGKFIIPLPEFEIIGKEVI